MMKLPSAPGGGSVPSGSRWRADSSGSGIAGRRRGVEIEPVVSMKNGAALSMVLASGGTAKFWLTQDGCANVIELSDVKERTKTSVLARTDNGLVI